jgi:predicted transposase/invertase (TIGR01784 family)
MREMALSDWTSGVNHARREGRTEGMQEGWKKGRAEGRQEGRQEGQKEIARNLLAEGLPVELIQKTTGLTEDQIREL